MKRMILAAMAAAGLAMTAQADFGGPGMPPPRGQGQPMMSPEEYRIQQERYGLLPMLRRVVWWKPAAPTPPNGHMMGPGPQHPTTGYVPGMYHPGMGGPGMYGPGMGGPGMYGPGMGGPQGTLVFPHHPFARSPRDYFMWEPGRR
jgi:hypothetical protein